MFLTQCRWWWWTVFGISMIVIIPKTFIKDLRFASIVALCISVYATGNNSFSIVNLITIAGSRGGYLGRCCVGRMTTRGKICRGMRFRRWKTVHWEVIVAKIPFIVHMWIFFWGLDWAVFWVKIEFSSVCVNRGADWFLF
mgnify:CR=1 FL=1